jgi:hypothetical protein
MYLSCVDKKRTFDGGDDTNNWQGPPHNADMSTQSVVINSGMTCAGDWVYHLLFDFTIFKIDILISTTRPFELCTFRNLCSYISYVSFIPFVCKTPKFCYNY